MMQVHSVGTKQHRGRSSPKLYHVNSEIKIMY